MNSALDSNLWPFLSSPSLWPSVPTRVQVAYNEALSDVNTSLESSTHPRSKQGCFSLLKMFISDKNATGYIWDQCCHLQTDGASLEDPHLQSEPEVTPSSSYRIARQRYKLTKKMEIY